MGDFESVEPGVPCESPGAIAGHMSGRLYFLSANLDPQGNFVFKGLTIFCEDKALLKNRR